ncbi:two pore calcium channel protein 1-like [Mizuhopecten yessoensis]|uniref:two pore calcium channel protein 1-like n=1 Tax=Mizuhopecten yessoensis TaxID=6573 RepID=UPI000B45967C|nr:two pore calcium channel protein 1-like [Mizuhopecten yessoensis]
MATSDTDIPTITVDPVLGNDPSNNANDKDDGPDEVVIQKDNQQSKDTLNTDTDYHDTANGTRPHLRGRKSVFGSSEKIQIKEQDLVLAVTLVKDATQGRNFTFKKQPQYVQSYNLYHKVYLRWLLYLFILLDLSLAMVEKPARPGWEIPYWASIIMEIVCLVYFLFRFCHAAYFTEPEIFWRDTKNILIIVSIILTFLDIICYIIWVNVAPNSNPVRWSRPLRPLFIINFSDGKQVRRAFRNIRRTVPEIMNVLILFLLSVLLFALLALKLFSKRQGMKYPYGQLYFKNYLDSIWDLYVLVTTANNPDVMMPAYDENKWFALFFIGYIIICLYIFMSIVLAAIYNNYRKNLKNEIKAAVYGKRKKLAEAFNILKLKRESGYVINHNTWCQLMRRVVPDKSQRHIDLLMRVLDVDANHTISKVEFLSLADLLELRLSEVRDRLTFLEQRIPFIYNSKISNFVKKVVRHKFFRFFFDFLIFLNAWFIGFDVDSADWFFLSLFMLEITFKLYVFGPREFFTRFWNIFDFLVIFSAAIASIIEAAEGASSDELRTLDPLLVLRVVRLIKIFGSIQRFKVILMTIVNIGPSILTYGGVIFVFYYIFAIIGMEVFHGLIRFYPYNSDRQPSELYCGNVLLNNTAFYRNHYCNNNFNDILRALVVLFELTVVNQWHVITSGFVIVTNKAARIYFFVFHLCCVVIVLNIFIAFILEAFILEYSLQKAGKMETFVEKKIKELGLGVGQVVKPHEKLKGDAMELVSHEEEPDRAHPPPGSANHDQGDESDGSDIDSIPDLSAEEGLRFHLRKKSRKKVEVLLQQMFEGEIDPEDLGSDLEEERPRTLTLDAVT